MVRCRSAAGLPQPPALLPGRPEKSGSAPGLRRLATAIPPTRLDKTGWSISSTPSVVISGPLHPSRGHSNHRLVSFTDGQVTFRWRDSAHQNEQKLLALSLDEFLRRFLLHLLPKGFVRIRNFGFLANRNRATLLPLCFQLLGAVAPPPTQPEASLVQPASPLWLCPQ